MSDKIDQRIVEMSFENHKFEKGILESKNSLKDFSNTLKDMGNGREFNGLDRSVQSISSSFSALEQIGIGALRRIGEAAINAGANIFKSLAIEPITQGFGEMELKMNSTQTIMASTGETLAVVNGYLEELNEYSDKTIYSFSDMTQNIGKFTNAGVKLDRAVASIKGISNAAALAGANSNEASRAMYNFAQALSSGYVKLIDWKSIELANMATVEFKQQLLDSAVAAGTLTKAANGMYKVLSTDMAGKTMDQTISATRNFNDSLQFQWMTTEALTGTLTKYADETTEIGKRASKAATQVTTFTKLMETLKESVGSGWARTFELIFGDFNEARDLWTGMNDVLGGMINKLSDTRNGLFSGGLGSGWKQFMNEGISDITTFGNTLAVVAGEAGIDIDNLVKNAGSMEKAVKGNWLTGGMLIETVSRMSSSIESLSGEQLKNAGYTEKTKSEILTLRDALRSGAISADEFATKIGQMSGRENIIQGFKSAVIALLTAVKPISKAFDQIFPPTTVRRLYNITESFKNFTERLIISNETANKIQRTFAGVFAVVDIGLSIVKSLGSAFLEIVQVFIPISGGFLDMTAATGDFLVVLNRIIKTSGVFEYSLLGIKIAAVMIRNIFTNIISTISQFTVGLWNADKPLEYIGALIQKIFGNIVDNIKMGVSWISGGFVNALSNASKFLNNLIGGNKGTVLSTLLSIFKEFVNLIINKATGGLNGFGEAIKNLDLNKIASFVIGGTLLLFVNQITHLSKSLSGLTDNASGFLNNLSKKLFGSNTKIKDMAYTIGILTASLFVLSRIPWPDLTKGLIGLGGALTIFVLAYAGIQAVNIIATKMLKDKEMIKSAFNLVSLATGLAIMAGALKIISSIDDDNIWRSVGIVGALMGFLTVYQGISGLIGRFAGGKIAVSILGMASGLLLLIGVIKIINNISDTEITDSLNKIGDILVAIGSVQLLFSIAAFIGGGNKLATSVLGMASGILMLIGIIKLINNMSKDEILAGMFKISFIATVMAMLQAMFSSVAVMTSAGKKASISILAMAGGVLAMLGLIKLVNLMTSNEILIGTINISFMMGMLAMMQAMFATATNLGKGNVTLAILAATASMAVMTGLISLINVYTPDQIFKGLATLAAMALLIGVIQFFTGVSAAISDGNKAAASILSITLLIVAMTGAIALLSVIPVESLQAASNAMINGAIAVGVIIAALAIFSHTAQNSVPKMLGLALSLVVFAGAVALMAIPITELAKLDVNGLTAGVIAVGALIGVFAGLTILFDTLNVGTASLIGLAASLVIFGAALTLISIPMAVLSSFDSSQITTTTLAFAGLLAVFAAMGLLNSGGVLAMGMLTAAAGVAAFGASLIVVAGSIALAGIGLRLGAEAFDILVNAFTNLLNTVQQNRETIVNDFKILGTAIGEGVFSGIKSFFGNIGNELQNVWATITTSIKGFFGIHSPSTVMAGIGTNISDGLWNGLRNGIINIKNNIGSYLSGIPDKIGGLVDSIAPIGRDLVRSIGDGIKRNTNTAVIAGITMAQDIEEAIRNATGIHSISPEYSDGIGSFIPKSIGVGIESTKDFLLNKAKLLGIDTGKFTLKGITEGLAGGEGTITTGVSSLLDLLTGNKSIKDAASDMGIQTGNTFSGAYSNAINGPATKGAHKAIVKDAFEIFKEGIDHRKEYNLISLGEELAEWENFTKKYVAGTEIRMKADKELARVRAEIDSKSFEHSKQWMEEEKYYKRLNLLEELAAWNRVQKRYEEGHAYRIQAEREMFRIKQEIQQSEFDNLANWIEEEKYYKRLSLQDELAAWTAVQQTYEKGTEQRKKADKEVFRLQEEIATKRKTLEDDYYKKTTEINAKLKQDIVTLEKAYTDAVGSRAKSLYDSYKLFNTVEVKDPIDGTQLLTNLEDQVTAFEAWQKSIIDLGSRGISDGLLNELKEMGPNAATEIKALNSLTDEQLTQYVNLWQKKHQDAKEQATLELEAMRVNTFEQIKILESDTATQLDDLKDIFDTGMKEISAISLENVKTMRAQMEEDIKAMNNSIQNQFKQMIADIKSLGLSEVSVVLNTNVDTNKINRQEFAEKYKEKIALISKTNGVDLGVAQSMLENDLRKDGEASIDGFANGMKSKQSNVIKVLTDIGTAALSVFPKILDMHSPSREFFKFGVLSMKGFTGGFIDQIQNVKDTGKLMALTAIDSLSPTALQMSTLLDDINIDPTIRPVLDLTNIKDGSKQIGELLGNRNFRLSEIANKTSSLVSKPVFTDIKSDSDGQSKSEASYSFVQNNYSPKPLSRIEIYRQTKNQFSTLKGLVKN